MTFFKLIILLFLVLSGFASSAQNLKHDSPGAGNPLLPGYFADPTVKKFGDTYYIYATTDGNGGGFGPSQVWSSKDFVNWSLDDMNWPATHHYWAPDVTQAKDGKYYIYYCQPVEIFGASSDSPVGPWVPLLPPGKPVVKNFLVPNVITLDGQTFKDDDGKMYMFWGTWGIYPKHGCGVGLLNDDMKTFAKLAQIPNTIAKDFFEAPFMFKRNGLYYLTYSSGRCEDDTYRVQYSVSKEGPMGPFVYGKNNPILTTNSDGTVHGPGHQSVLQENKDFYLIYHRHNNPHSGGGYHRQVAADKLQFDEDGNIKKVVPSHEGIGYLAKTSNPQPDLALNSKVTASSFYSEDFKPEFAVDNNNGTLWKPKSNTTESWLSIDLGSLKQVRSIQTQFEYATWYYQYLIEYSSDGNNWNIFSDKRTNTIHGSPMIDIGNVKARYIRISILNTEYPGLNKAIWNIRVFSEDSYHPKSNVVAKKPSSLTAIKPQGLLIDLDASDLKLGSALSQWENKGKLGGQFIAEGDNTPAIELLDGKKAVMLSGKASLVTNVKPPESLLGNSSFSVAAWVYNDSIEDEEPILSWTDRGGVDLTNASLSFGSNKKFGAAGHWGWPDMAYKKLPTAQEWHHIALVFDGTMEKLYIDGVLDHQELKMLFIANLKNFMLGTNGDHSAYFSGAISSLKLYDVAISEAEVVSQSKETGKTDIAVYLEASKLDYAPLINWKNEGSLKGNLAFKDSPPSITDYKGKIAIVFKEQELQAFKERLNNLMSKLGGRAYTSVAVMVSDKFKDEKWHQVVSVSDGGETSVYIDGKLDASKMYEGILNADFKLKALSSVIVYDQKLEATEVLNLYSDWQKTLSVEIPTATFADKPIALSPGMVQMKATKAKLPGKILEYAFTSIDNQGIHNSSGWVNKEQYIDFNTTIDHNYLYALKARDNFGNVTKESIPFKVSTNAVLFNIAKDHFYIAKDYQKNLSGSIWDGITGKIDSVKAEQGELLIKSSDSKFDGSAKQGPFLYKSITGDFMAEVLVADVSGLKEKKTNGANDVGLMILSSDGSANLIQNSIFPGWGVGNMVTNLTKDGRFQFNNSSAWEYLPYLQIQRQGKIFHLRASKDGKHWVELPGSPLTRNDIPETVKVGLYQATYGENSGFGKFKDLSLITRKP
jgi:hypothetical protein